MKGYAVIGIDPGDTEKGKYGVALVGCDFAHSTFLEWYSSSRAPDPLAETCQLSMALAYAQEQGYGEIFVAIEDQYVGKDRRNSLKMAHKAGRWTMAADIFHLEWKLVLPRAWQSILKAEGYKNTKNASRGYVKSTYKLTVDEHQADAICLAEYRCNQLIMGAN